MIWNLGSINIDNFYRVPHLPGPGETLPADEYSQGLGGKGANMSIAAARAAARVSHIGAVGPDGGWTVERLLEYGVETQYIAKLETASGHANICVDRSGENNIVLFGGANLEVSENAIGGALTVAAPGDFLLMQNETNGQAHAATIARQLGLKVVYAAAPFSAEAITALKGMIDILVLNEVEAAQLEKETGTALADLGITDIVVTMGERGCRWIAERSGCGQDFGAVKVDPVDTTGAGDTFTGYLIAGLDRSMTMVEAINLALKAAALMVTRQGTGDVIPDLKEIQDHFRDLT